MSIGDDSFSWDYCLDLLATVAGITLFLAAFWFYLVHHYCWILFDFWFWLCWFVYHFEDYKQFVVDMFELHCWKHWF
jgi:hypothetical protein